MAGVIRSLVNTIDLQLQYARVLHETLLEPVLMYSSENVMEEISSIRLYRWTTSEVC